MNLTPTCNFFFSIDGRPPEIPITEISKGLYHVSVEWDNVLVPLGGELQGYKTYVYDTSNSLVYSITVDDGSITEYTFSGLEPDTQYRFSVVGFNMFGDGNVSNVLQVKTLTPLGKFMYTLHNIYIYTYILTCTYIRTYIRACIHDTCTSYIHTYIHIYIHVHTYIHTCT